mmetsp:Transcript_10146/g.11648  ORF Transcript_10146/g.11648 Transcript_10146/m.11648 type:complete len:345 (-) Transcript_10146:365-1399(-)
MSSQKVDKVYATTEENVEHLHAAANHILGDSGDHNDVTVIGEAAEGFNPYGAVTNCIEGYIDLPHGHTRRFRVWIPEDGKVAKGTVVLIHGYGEHSGKYHHVAHSFNQAGYQVFTYDLKYHGADENAVGHKIRKITSFGEFIDDAENVVKLIEEKFTEKPYFILGHSMGGLIAFLTALRLQDTWRCSGVILSNPAIRLRGNALAPNPYHPFFHGLTKTLAIAAPTLPTPGAQIKDLSKDKEVKKALKDDSLSFGDKIIPKFAKHFLGGTIDAVNGFKSFKAPILILAGMSDKVVNPNWSKKLIDEIASEDKEFSPWEGEYHEMFNDDRRDEILAYCEKWMDNRV